MKKFYIKDKFILSKSHASFPLSILLREKGFKTAFTTHFEIDPKMEFIVQLEVWGMDCQLLQEWQPLENTEKKWKYFCVN